MGKQGVDNCLLAAMLSVLTISQALIQPSRHTYPSPGLQSVNGSDPNGGCTDQAEINGVHVCRLGNSSLVDGSIPTLTPSLVGANNWAAGLFTVHRNGGTSIEIGFELNTSIRLIQVELDLFNCPEWGIAAPNITVYTWNVLPGRLPSPRALAPRLGGVTTLNSTSCDSITRVLIPLQQDSSSLSYYLEFTFDDAPSVQWVHLAEVRFFNSTPPPTPTTSSMSTPTDITLQPQESNQSSPLPTATVTVTNTLLRTVQLTPTQSMLPGRDDQQDCACDDYVATFIAAVTMGAINVLFLAVVFVLVVALIHNRKRQVKDTHQHYEDIRKSTRFEMKENIAYGNYETRDTEIALSGTAEYEEIDPAH